MVFDSHKILDYLYIGREMIVREVLYLMSFACARVYIISLFVLNAANWLLARHINANVSQDLVVLHYNVNLGANLIGQARDIYIIPTLGLSFIVINFILLLSIFRENKFFIHFVLGFSLLANLFLIAGTLSVYLANFR